MIHGLHSTSPLSSTKQTTMAVNEGQKTILIQKTCLCYFVPLMFSHSNMLYQNKKE